MCPGNSPYTPMETLAARIEAEERDRQYRRWHKPGPKAGRRQLAKNFINVRADRAPRFEPDRRKRRKQYVQNKRRAQRVSRQLSGGVMSGKQSGAGAPSGPAMEE